MDPEIIDEEEEMVTVGLGEEGGEEPGAAEEEPYGLLYWYINVHHFRFWFDDVR